MTVTRLGRSFAVAFVGVLLAIPARATANPRVPAPAGPKLRLAAPTLLAEAAAAVPSGDGGPAPYAPPQQPPPGYPVAPYPPPPYAMPYYYQPRPVDMRPPVLDYEPGRPVPPGYRVESYARKGFVVSGSIIFGISYGTSLLIAGSVTEASSSNSVGSSEVPFNPGMLYIPVIGPWIALGTLKTYNCPSSSYSYSCMDAKSESDDWRTVLIFDGVAQVWGAAFVVLGVSWRWHQLVLTENLRAQIVPAQFGATGRGVAMVGTFGGL